MITSWQLYCLTRLDYIQDSATFFALFSFVVAVTASLILLLPDIYDDDDNKKKCKKVILVSLMLWIPSCLLSLFIPTTKEMAAILILPKIINKEKAQELPDNLLNLANEWIKELSPTEKKEK